MTKTAVLISMIILSGMLATASSAQLNLGSDGTDGALVVSSNMTLDVPEPDGIFNYTTVEIQSGFTLQFNPNSLNTPVYLLATGDVVINGAIDVNGGNGTSTPPVGGKGGPGGFDGGVPGAAGSPPGPGHGPGGAKAGGRASHNGLPGVDPSNPNNGAPYGSPLLVPLVGGSGGGGGDGTPGTGGGGGGGAILIASNTEIRIVGGAGTVVAIGGTPFERAGSSGSVRLVAPKVSGNGVIRVPAAGGHGAHGRIRVDTIDRREMSLSFDPATSLSVGGFMRVFADPPPSLALTHVAGMEIAEGAPQAVTVVLPNNSPANQLVRVQARNFTGMLPIRVVLVPDSGDPVIQDATINMTTNPASADLMMNFPLNTPVAVEAFTR